MACESYLNAINELVDGTLGPLRAAELQLHLESCESCARLVVDLREIVRRAQSLDDLQPPPRIWTHIADQLAKEGRVAAPSGSLLSHANYTVLALAAALLLAVGASLMLVIPRETAPTAPVTETVSSSPPLEPAGNVPDCDVVQGVAPGITAQFATIDKGLLNVIEETKKTAISPETVAELQNNYQIITDAVAKSCKALASDPLNVVARDSYYDIVRRKIRFLQDTIALMNEMRQGDAAGAAQIVEGGKS